jgi:hypothetical protein
LGLAGVPQVQPVNAGATGSAAAEVVVVGGSGSGPVKTIANVLLPDPKSDDHPTVRHDDGLKHDTELSTLLIPTLGLGTTDHTDPFQDSTNVSWPAPLLDSPTVTHDEVETHDTDRSSFAPIAALGLGTTDHTDPFQDSTNVT